VAEGLVRVEHRAAGFVCDFVLFIAIGCMHGLYGFVLRMFGDDRCITRLKEYRGQALPVSARRLSGRLQRRRRARLRRLARDV